MNKELEKKWKNNIKKIFNIKKENDIKLSKKLLKEIEVWENLLK